MSDQNETAVITSLEQVFLSTEFGHARTGRSVLDYLGEDAADIEDLERAYLSDLPSELRESNRHRTIAAVSGIAAAALVIAGLAAGGPQPGRGVVSAEGQGIGSHPLPGGGSGIPSDRSSGAAGAGVTGTTTAEPSTLGGAPSAFLTQEQAGQSVPAPAVTVQVPPGSTVTVVPSPAAAPSGRSDPGTGAAAGTSAPPPPATPGSPNPAAPVVVVVGNTATAVGTAVTTTTGQVGSSLSEMAPVAPVAPVTDSLSGVGATVIVLGQSLNSTTA